MSNGTLRSLARIGVLVAGGLTAAAGRRPEAASERAHAHRRTTPGWRRFFMRWAYRAIVLGGLGGLAALILVLSGMVSIKASSGHWALTEAFLQFAKRRSIATHALLLAAPPLDEPRLIVTGASHYDLACGPCHGSPAAERPGIVRHMLPPPPDLRESVARYDPEELFHVVKHGIKLTGMPAWPAPGRNDEVWAMVAFLRRLPRLEAREYRELSGRPGVNGEVVEIGGLAVPEPPAAILENCGRCHGVDGMGRGAGAFPRLAGQKPGYLLASLRAYARGERHSGIMQLVAANLDPAGLERVAAYYASRRAFPLPAAGEPSAIEAGRAIVHRGIAEQLVPPCAQCHGPAPQRRNPYYPIVAGQHPEYIEQQLKLFKAGARGGTPYRDIMRRVAVRLSDQQMRAVAAYYASLDPGSD
jgi:cytochrome c553